MIMDDVSARINQLLSERGISKFELSKRCPGVSRASVYNAANGYKRVTIETIYCICCGLEISMGDFFNWENDCNIHISSNERDLIEEIRNLTPDQVSRLTGYMHSMAEENKNSVIIK